MSPSLGLLEWFRPGEEDRVDQVLDDLDRLGVTRLRTGISWAEYCTPAGAAWYQWLFPRLAARCEILPCFLYTPPSIGLRPKVSAPPLNLRAYADWLDHIITLYGNCFEYVELWNEPNNLSEWDWTLDPDWLMFCEMIGAAAYWSRQRGKKTVLGGMAPIDPQWLALMIKRGLIDHFDVVGLHAFPALWECNWPGWDAQLQPVRELLVMNRCNARVWITETGYSTWRHDEFGQINALLKACDAPAERVYWYAFQDLHPDNGTPYGFHTDEREYHLGIKDYTGRPKLLYRAWAEGGLQKVRDVHQLGHAQPRTFPHLSTALVVGGAGRIGSLLCTRLAQNGRPVIVYDNLSSRNADLNLQQLKNTHDGLLEIRIADVRDFYRLRDAVSEAATVFYLAAEHQAGPGRLPPEFETNLRGTLNLLEALRAMKNPPALVAASAAAANDAQDLYSASRAAADRYVATYASCCNLPVAVVRFDSPERLNSLSAAVDALLAAEDRFPRDQPRQKSTQNANSCMKGDHRARSRR